MQRVRLLTTDRRPANSLAGRWYKESRRFSFEHARETVATLPIAHTPIPRILPPLSIPLNNLHSCQRHVWRGCAQPSATYHCIIITYRAHAACRRLPRIFCESCQGCRSLSPSLFLFSIVLAFFFTVEHYLLHFLDADTRDYSLHSPWHNKRGSRAACLLVSFLSHVKNG